MKINNAVLFIDLSTKYLLVQQGLSNTDFYVYEDYQEMISEKKSDDIGFWRLSLKSDKQESINNIEVVGSKVVSG